MNTKPSTESEKTALNNGAIMHRKLLSVYEKQCKYFTKQVEKIDGKIYQIRRIMKDGSGVDYEKKMCGNCGLKYRGARLKIGYGETIIFYCPICGRQ